MPATRRRNSLPTHDLSRPIGWSSAVGDSAATAAWPGCARPSPRSHQDVDNKPDLSRRSCYRPSINRPHPTNRSRSGDRADIQAGAAEKTHSGRSSPCTRRAALKLAGPKKKKKKKTTKMATRLTGRKISSTPTRLRAHAARILGTDPVKVDRRTPDAARYVAKKTSSRRLPWGRTSRRNAGFDFLARRRRGHSVMVTTHGTRQA